VSRLRPSPTRNSWGLPILTSNVATPPLRSLTGWRTSLNEAAFLAKGGNRQLSRSKTGTIPPRAPSHFRISQCLRASVVGLIGEEPAKIDSNRPNSPKPSLAHRVKPLFSPPKAPNSFCFLFLRSLHPQISSPKNILFAYCSLPRHTSAALRPTQKDPARSRQATTAIRPLTSTIP